MTGLIICMEGCSIPFVFSQEESIQSESSVETLSESVSDNNENYDISEEHVGVMYNVPIIINQLRSVFGEMGCAGAAGLMALQAAGYERDINTDEEMERFWDTVPISTDIREGWNKNSGILNPAFTRWLSQFAPVQEKENINVEDIKRYISDGYVVIPLVSLGEDGTATHWFTVYGCSESEETAYFYVADSWGGAARKLSSDMLSERMLEGARRKALFGYGNETDCIIIPVRI